MGTDENLLFPIATNNMNSLVVCLVRRHENPSSSFADSVVVVHERAYLVLIWGETFYVKSRARVRTYWHSVLL